MNLKARKPNYKVSPLFALTVAEKNSLLRMLIPSIEALKQNSFQVTDWYNITFRLKAGVEIAKVIYTTENLKDMEESFSACLSIKNRYVKTSIFNVTENEISHILTGLDAVDQMQNEVTRKQLTEAHLKAEAYLVEFRRKPWK